MSTPIRELARSLQFVDALSRAGQSPTRFAHIHVLAYLSEALAPVWGLDVLSGQVLKRNDLPFFPSLQRALDDLVWRGLLEIVDFSYFADETGRWKMDATCVLKRESSQPVLDLLNTFDDERTRHDLYLEIALGLLRNHDIEQLFRADASYSDPAVSINRLIALSNTDGTASRTSAAAERFDELSIGATRLSPGQKVGLYMNHLGRLAQRA